MTYLQLALIHLATVLPAFIIGTVLLFSRKGTEAHRKYGKVYLVLMLLTGAVTLFMPAEVGPRFMGHFGYLHSLSLLTLFTVPTAYFAAKNHNVSLHRNCMIGLYAGGILIAGSFALMPGRLLHGWIFN